MHYLAICLLVLFFTQAEVSVGSSPCQHSTKLVIGVVPWTSAKLTQLWAEKLVNFFTENSCIQARFASARNFEEFITRSINGDFDFIDVPPHIASYLILSHGFKAAAIEEWDSHALVITRTNSKITDIQQAANNSVAIPDPLAAVTLFAKPLFKRFSVDQTRFVNYPNNDSVLSAVLNGEVDSGVVISTIYNSYAHIIKDRIRILHQGESQMQGPLLAKPSIDSATIAHLNNELSDFDEGTTRLWQKWNPVDKKKIEYFHQQQRENVGHLERFFAGTRE